MILHYPLQYGLNNQLLRMLIERFIENPHHIEIQVLADMHGNVVAFPERFHQVDMPLIGSTDGLRTLCLMQGVLGAAPQPEGGGGVSVLSADARHSPRDAAAGYPAVQGHRIPIGRHGGDARGRPPELLLPRDEHQTALVH